MAFTEISLDLNPNASFSLEDEGALIRRTITPEGIRILSSHIPHWDTVSFGLWVGAGSRDETDQSAGSTHFLEHLLFKGTSRKDAKEISDRIDFLGGNFNAATAKQYTCYYGKVLKEDSDEALSLLAEMVMDARLAKEDMELERGVILEELAMYNDDASEVASEDILARVFGDHPYSRPIGGTKESVLALSHEQLLSHYRHNYCAQELVVTASGCVDHDWLVDRIRALVNEFGWESEGTPHPRTLIHPIKYSQGEKKYIHREVEQTAVAWAMPGITINDPRKYALLKLSVVLGGGTSSRLFQKIREERGLAYSTYSSVGAFPEGGIFGLYAGCSPENAEEVAGLLFECLQEIADTGITDYENESAYRRLRAEFVFGRERIASRMTNLGVAEVIQGELVSPREQLARHEKVTPAQVQALAQELVTLPQSMTMVGPQKEN